MLGWVATLEKNRPSATLLSPEPPRTDVHEDHTALGCEERASPLYPSFQRCPFQALKLNNGNDSPFSHRKRVHVFFACRVGCVACSTARDLFLVPLKAVFASPILGSNTQRMGCATNQACWTRWGGMCGERRRNDQACRLCSRVHVALNPPNFPRFY